MRPRDQRSIHNKMKYEEAAFSPARERYNRYTFFYFSYVFSILRSFPFFTSHACHGKKHHHHHHHHQHHHLHHHPLIVPRSNVARSGHLLADLLLLQELPAELAHLVERVVQSVTLLY